MCNKYVAKYVILNLFKNVSLPQQRQSLVPNSFNNNSLFYVFAQWHENWDTKFILNVSFFMTFSVVLFLFVSLFITDHFHQFALTTRKSVSHAKCTFWRQKGDNVTFLVIFLLFLREKEYFFGTPLSFTYFLCHKCEMNTNWIWHYVIFTYLSCFYVFCDVCFGKNLDLWEQNLIYSWNILYFFWFFSRFFHSIIFFGICFTLLYAHFRFMCRLHVEVFLP